MLKDLLPYYSHHSKVTYHESILLKSQRITVSTTFCSEMNLIIHQGHFWHENLKNCSCQGLFWPLINTDIKDMTNFPTFCHQHPSEPEIKHLEHWTNIAVELLRLYGHYYYLLIADYNPKFVAVENLRNSQSLKSVRIYFCNMVFLRN